MKHALREEVPVGQNSPAGIQQRHAKWPLTSKLCVALHQQDRQVQASRAGRRHEATTVSRGLLFWSNIVAAEERSVHFPSQVQLAGTQSSKHTPNAGTATARGCPILMGYWLRLFPSAGLPCTPTSSVHPCTGPTPTQPPTCFVSHSERTSCSTGIGSW